MEKLKQIKKWVIEQVIWAEREMKGRDGKEKKAIVVAKIDEMIKLPFWLEWADRPLISWLVDLACEKLNWLTDRDFSGLEASEDRSVKLAAVMEAPLSAIKSISESSAEKKSFELAQKMPEALAAEICRERKLYYDKIISKDGKQDVFRMGWYRRVHDLAKTAGVKSPVE